MNGLMKKNVHVALSLSLMFAGSTMVAMNKGGAKSDSLKNIKKSEQVELKDLNVKPEAKPDASPQVTQKETLSLKQRFVAACKAKLITTGSWFSDLFSNFFSWIKTQFGSLKDRFKNLKMAQWFSKKQVQKDDKLKNVMLPKHV